MICHGRLPCEAAWPRLMHRRRLWSFRSVCRRVPLLSVLCSAAPVAPSPETQAPSAPREPQDGLLSFRQLVRTYGARAGDQKWFSSSAAASSSSSSATPGAPVSALLHSELLESARLSRLAGLCYWPHQQLAEQLQAEGVKLVAQGSNYFTSWYVCDADSWPALPSAPAQSAAAATADGSVHASSATAAPGSPGLPASAGAAGAGPNRDRARLRRRLVLLRGVTWFAPDVESVRVWGLLMRAWPTPFMESGTRRTGELLAHAGVAQMASEMYEILLPHLATAEPTHLTFAGHSMGGALAMLLTAMARLQLRHPAEQLACQTFGSPPVLAHRDGGGSADVLKALDMPASSMRSFVLEGDVIPRAMLSSDPSFTLLKRWSVVRAGLQLRETLFGSGVPLSPSRFLFDSVGDTYLIRWDAKTGPQVVPLTAEAIEAKMQRATDELLSFDGQRLMQAWLDHLHSSYTQELEAAAKLESRRNPNV